jgi:pilus assembly protein CpaF
MASLDDLAIDMLIASCDFRIDHESIPPGCMLVYSAEIPDINEFNNKQAICKYQKPEAIYKAIMEFYSTTHQTETNDKVHVLFPRSDYSLLPGEDLGSLDLIFQDETITKVMINGLKAIFIEKDGVVHRSDEAFEDQSELDRIVQKILEASGQELNAENPFAAMYLPSGCQVSIASEHFTANGKTMTVSRAPAKPIAVAEMIENGTASTDIAGILELLVKAKYNILISGSSSSGKTTLLNILSNFIPKQERIVSIEGFPELRINASNLLKLVTCNTNVTAANRKTIGDLIRFSSTMYPDRMVIGDLHGSEVLDVIQTGHEGLIATCQASSAEDLLSRLEMMVYQNTDNIPLKAVRQRIASVIDIIIHVSKLRDQSRKIVSISEVSGFEDADCSIRLNPLYIFQEDEESTLSKASGNLVRTENQIQKKYKLEQVGLTETI